MQYLGCKFHKFHVLVCSSQLINKADGSYEGNDHKMVMVKPTLRVHDMK